MNRDIHLRSPLYARQTALPARAAQRLQRMGMLDVDTTTMTTEDSAVVDFIIPYPWGEEPTRGIGNMLRTRSTISYIGDHTLTGADMRMPTIVTDISSSEVRRAVDESLPSGWEATKAPGGGISGDDGTRVPHVRSEINLDGYDQTQFLQEIESIIDTYHEEFGDKYPQPGGEEP